MLYAFHVITLAFLKKKSLGQLDVTFQLFFNMKPTDKFDETTQV